MIENEKEFNFSEIEKKWQKKWDDSKVFIAEKSDKEKYYVLEMFPYPSGRLHMGHVRNYSIGDVVARYKRMQGYNVLHPMGWDSFGLPAENAAIKNNIPPYEWTTQNIQHMKDQFGKLGYSYDWTKEVATYKKEYYQWNQWLFTKMYEKGLAYKKNATVNWCPTCSTVLANEQVEDGACWRCDDTVAQKELEQWFFKITDYAEDLLKGHEELKEGWPERVITMQKNWIGKSVGLVANFKLESGEDFPIFTTRPDTIFGVTFMVVAPEHPLLEKIDNPELQAFIKKISSESLIERTAENKEKEGMDTGLKVTNPFTGEKVPLFVGNFVLMEYGTGAIMAVPTHDTRDFAFAKKYNIPLKLVIDNPKEPINVDEMQDAYIDEGVLVNSGEFDGLNNKAAIKKIIEFAEQDRDIGAVRFR
jgi:leucyl-tRNA synthetase